MEDGRQLAISTCRAGNVIGGGDFATDRIIPDCVRAAQTNNLVILRNPNSIRPYQHVLEPLFAYILIAQKQYENKSLADNYNVGPNEKDCVTTSELVSLFCNKWQDNLRWASKSDSGPHEANFLKLDCSKIKNKLCWVPKFNIENAIEKTTEWYKAYLNNEDVSKLMENQIKEYTNWR